MTKPATYIIAFIFLSVSALAQDTDSITMERFQSIESKSDHIIYRANRLETEIKNISSQLEANKTETNNHLKKLLQRMDSNAQALQKQMSGLKNEMAEQYRVINIQQANIKQGLLILFLVLSVMLIVLIILFYRKIQSVKHQMQYRDLGLQDSSREVYKNIQKLESARDKINKLIDHQLNQNSSLNEEITRLSKTRKKISMLLAKKQKKTKKKK